MRSQPHIHNEILTKRNGENTYHPPWGRRRLQTEAVTVGTVNAKFPERFRNTTGLPPKTSLKRDVTK
jgi:hypothetical protein